MANEYAVTEMNSFLTQITAAKWEVREFTLEPTLSAPVCSLADDNMIGHAKNMPKAPEAFTVFVAEGLDKDGNPRRLSTAYDRLARDSERLRLFTSRVLLEAVQSLFE